MGEGVRAFSFASPLSPQVFGERGAMAMAPTFSRDPHGKALLFRIAGGRRTPACRWLVRDSCKHPSRHRCESANPNIKQGSSFTKNRGSAGPAIDSVLRAAPPSLPAVRCASQRPERGAHVAQPPPWDSQRSRHHAQAAAGGTTRLSPVVGVSHTKNRPSGEGLVGSLALSHRR